jgi:hypothetical protein
MSAGEIKRFGNMPWDWTGTPQYVGGAFHCYIVDATGRKIGTVWGPSEEKIERARLWSAAPMLLEGAEDAVIALKLLRTGLLEKAPETIAVIDAHIDELEYAIGKARAGQ